MKKAIITAIVISALLISLVFGMQVVGANSKTITVPDDYQSIQAAIDNALEGDRVVVRSGTYNGSIWINKAISLVGENSARIIGDYRLNGTVILVTSDNVNITGFTVEPSASSPSRRGVHLLDANHCNIYNNTFINNKIGIWLYGSSENTITGNSVFGSGDIFGEIDSYGAQLHDGSNHNSIENNIFENNHYGIYIYSSSNNNVKNNRVKNSFSTGITINADENWLTDNVVEGNIVGLELHGSNNVLRNNQLSNNTANFNIEWDYYEDTSTFFNDVDASNTINGKPIIYWVNKQDEKVPEDTPFLVLVNCTNITVENLKLSKNRQGIILVATTNSTIRENSVEVLSDGILVYASFNNKITNNIVFDGGRGIHLFSSFQNTITGNSINNRSTAITLEASNENIINSNIISGGNSGGIDLDGSNSNKIFNNTISDCKRMALWFWNHASQNLFYLNNFINNTKNVEEYITEFQEFPKNIWDNGTIGNFWNNYNGTDNDGDGIGDTPYIIDENNQDNYPLMTPANISTAPTPSPSTSPSPTLSPSPTPSTQQPTLMPSPTAYNIQAEDYTPTLIIYTSIAVVAAVVALVYFKKRKG